MKTEVSDDLDVVLQECVVKRSYTVPTPRWRTVVGRRPHPIAFITVPPRPMSTPSFARVGWFTLLSFCHVLTGTIFFVRSFLSLQRQTSDRNPHFDPPYPYFLFAYSAAMAPFGT